MAQKAGRTVLLKLGDGGSPESFNNLCGIATRSMTINNNVVDTSIPDCDSPGGVVKYTGGYGIQQVTISGDGRYTDEANHTALGDVARQQSDQNAQMVVPGWGTFEGAIKVQSYEVSGETEGNAAFSTEITFSGDVTFTAEGS